MSFSIDIKKEILANDIESNCCKIAFLTGLIKTTSRLNFENKSWVLEIKTENYALCEKLQLLIESMYGTKPQILEDEHKSKTINIRYSLKLASDLSRRILQDCEVLDYTETTPVLNQNLNAVIENECCKRHFIMGVFVGCATTNIILKSINPNIKHSGGYHLEYVLNSLVIAKQMQSLLLSINIPAKIALRKNQHLVYIKEAEQVSDMLAYVGANDAVLKLQNEITVRQVRNNVNRQNNCLSGNITKTIDAAMRQIECIEMISQKIGLSALDEELQELCLLRLANPDEPLINLIKLYSKPISKSGINYRFSKIEKIALNLLDL